MMTLTVEHLKEILESNQFPVIDIRLIRAFAEEHIAGSQSLPFRQEGWAALVRQAITEPSVVLLTDNPRLGTAAKEAWEQAGGTVVAVWDQGLGPWKQHGAATVQVKHVTVDELAHRLGAFSVIDVREPYEWRSGIIPGAKTIPLGTLSERLAELPKDRHHVVVCAHGNRSLTGAAFLAERGYTTFSVLGGMALWLGAGHPIDRWSID